MSFNTPTASAVRRLASRQNRLPIYLTLLVFIVFLPAEAFPAGSVNPANQWVSIGPDGGFVEFVAADPLTPGRFYAGAYAAGLFQSTDRGLTWQRLDNYNAPYPYSIAFHPTQAGTFWVGDSSGVRLTTDGGLTWTMANTGLSGNSFKSLAVDQTNPQRLWAGSQSAGLFRTVDGGQHWTPANTGLTSTFIAGLAVDPNDGQVVYAAVWGGMFKSVNGGESWLPSNTGMTSMSFTLLAMVPGNALTLYAGTGGNSFYKTVDGGATWTSAASGLSGSYHRALAIHPAAPQTLYLATNSGLFKSTDGAASWTPSGAAEVFAPVYGVAVNIDDSNVVLAGAVAGAGLYRSENGGGAWAPANSGFRAYRVAALASHPTDPLVLYGGTSGGVLKTVDGGASWALKSADGLNTIDINRVAVANADPQTVCGTSANGNNGFRRSTNGGENWTTHPSGVADFVAIDPTNSLIAYVCTQAGLKKTTDGGTTWTAAGTGLPTVNDPYMVAIDPTNALVLYAAVYHGGVYKSTDGAGTWAPANTGFPTTTVRTVAIDPTNPLTLYAGSDSGVYRSTDGGAGWALRGTTPGGTICRILVDPLNPQCLYVGYINHTVYRSIDGGAAWFRLTNSMPSADLNDLALTLSGATRTLYAAFEGKSVYAYTFAETAPSILRQPQSVTTEWGAPVTLSVSFAGAEPLTVQWYQGEAGDTSHPVGSGGSTFNTGTLLTTTPYWVRITNNYGHADSRTATVTAIFPLHAAHAASSALWWTRLNLINTADDPGVITLTAYQPDGGVLETVALPPLASHAAVQTDVAAVFQPTTLSNDFRIVATGTSTILGVVEFGTTDNGSYVALPMVAQGINYPVFPYVVAAFGWYTGITLVNTGTETAHLSLTACSEAGAVLDVATRDLNPGQKFVSLANQIFPLIADPSTIRFLRVESSQPLVGFELFGNMASQGLAGLPPFSGAPPTRRTGDGGESAGGPESVPFLYYLYYPVIPDNAQYYTGVTFSNQGAAAADFTARTYAAAGTPLKQNTVNLPPLAQFTREVWNVFDGVADPAAAWMKVEGPVPLMGFEVFLSRSWTDPFRLDGLPGVQDGLRTGYFPVVKTRDGWSTTLRAVNLSGNGGNLAMYGYDSSGNVVANSVLRTIPALGALDIPLASAFEPAALKNLAWIEVGVTQPASLHVTLSTADLTRMGSYLGIP